MLRIASAFSLETPTSTAVLANNSMYLSNAAAVIFKGPWIWFKVLPYHGMGAPKAYPIYACCYEAIFFGSKSSKYGLSSGSA